MLAFRFEEHMKHPIRMHNIRKRMGKVSSSLNVNELNQAIPAQDETPKSSLVTSKNDDCRISENGRQLVVDEFGREVDPIEIFARQA